MAVRSLSGVRASEVNPSFLHANSTSHTWIFSAIAELIDNAYDPDVAATQLWIEKRMINGQVTLVFVDNGNGMNPDRLHKMLSFGFSEKQEVRGHRPIGQYGNGFKSGSMRLGKDVLVFTRQRGTMSVGFLSQTYLQSINAKTVFVPIVTWRLPSKQIVQSAECYASLKEILRHSIFRTERSIIQELDALGCIGHSGTEIIIYNLKRDRRGNLELDFESDPNDILNPQTLELDRSMMFRNVAEPTPAFRRSLREYCSILYLKPRMKIMLRGEKVKTKLVSRSLSRTEKDVYKPHFLPRPVKIIFGFSPTKGEDYGIMMYHKNRLIIAYEKVGYQKQANELGVGVVGVVELNFLEPIHNKQDFNKTIQYNSCVNALGVKLNEYWNEKTKGVTPGNRMIGPGSRPPDWLWAQCDKCLKWRRLPPTISENQLPKKWFCHMNHDATRNRCDIPEEAEDDDDVVMRPSYEKTYKKQMEERKRLQRIEQLRQMQNREKQLQMREEELKRMKSSLSAQNNSPAASNPSSQPGGSGSSTPSSGQVFPTGSITPNTSVQTPATADADADVKPTEAELLRAQQELSEAKRQETQQTKLIEQLQQQKDLLELKKKDVLKMAESLTMKQLQETEKNGSGETLSFGGGVKRGLEEDKEESENKRVRVVTSDGEVVYVVQRDEAPKPLIDLTMSDDEETAAPEPQEKPSEPASEPPPTINNEPPAEEERDIKPDLDELDRRIAEAQRALGMVDEAPADANNAAETTTNMESSTGETTAASEETPNAASAEVNGVDRETADIPPVTKFEAPSEDSNAESDRALESRNSNANSETAAENLTNGITDAAVSSADKSQSNKENVEAPMETEGENGEKNTEEGTGQKKDSAADNVSASDKVSPVDKGNVAEEDMDDDDFGGDFGDDFEDDDDFLRETETPESNAEKTADGQTNGSVSENKDSTVPTENSSEAKDKETSDKSISPPPEKADAKEEDKKDSEEKVDVKEDSDVKKETKPDLPLDSGDIKSETKPKLSKVLKTRGMQTLPVEMKSMLPDSYNFSKLTPCEIHHLLVQRTNELEGLRKNVRELLRIILPEVDLGTPDSIDQVVQEVIRVNQTSESSSEPDPTPPPP